MHLTLRRAALTIGFALIPIQSTQAQDGSFDPGFRQEGRHLQIFNSQGIPDDWGNSIAVNSRGQLLLGGDCRANDAGNSPVCVGWLKANGEGVEDGFGNVKHTTLGNRPDLFPGRQQMSFHGLAVQRDDRPVLASHQLLATGLNETRITRLKATGEFEALADGAYYRRVLFGGGDPSLADDVINQVVIAPDGKIIVAGTTGYHYDDGDGGEVVDRDMGVARFNTDMTPDTSFYGDGTTTVSFDQGGDNYDVANAVAVQPDGKIVLAGVARSGDGSINMDGALVRLNVDGSLDTSFGNGGKVTVPPIPWSDSTLAVNSVTAIAIDRHGSILIGGSLRVPQLGTQMFVARFDEDGQRDTGFAAGVLTGFATYHVAFTDPPRSEGFGLLISGNGDIFSYGAASRDQQTIPASWWILLRLTPNGIRYDSTAGPYGEYAPPQGPFPATNDARGAVIANGGLYITGRAFDYGGDTYFGVAKLRIDAIFKDGFDP